MAATQIRGNTQIMPGTVDDTIVDASVLVADGANALTGDLDAGTNRVVNLAAPASDNDAARLVDVLNARHGIDLKDSVRVATTTNITLSGTQTIDGVALSVGDRVLVKDQTAGEENGIYVVAAGAWARSEDADSDAEVTNGMTVWVGSEGSVNLNTRWVLTTGDPIVVDTTSLTFTQDNSGASVTAGAGLVQTGSAFDVVAGDDSLVVNANDVAVNRDTAGALVLSASGIAVNVGSGVLITGNAVVLDTSKFVKRETPTGLVNGSNTTYTLAATPVAGKEEVYLNGLLLEPGAGNDYTISGDTITMLSAPPTGDKLRVSYIAQ